jgi:hypothetical protein
MTESDIMDEVRLVLGAHPDACFFRNNVGMADFKGGRAVRFGVGGPGGSDLIGIFRGRAVFVEIKSATGRQSIEQQTFARLAERKGAIYRIVRSADEARALLADLEERFK